MTCAHTPTCCLRSLHPEQPWICHTYFRRIEVGRFSALKKIFISIFSSSVTRNLLFLIIAGGQLRAEPNLPIPEQISEEGELSENDDFQSFQTPVDKPREVNSSKTSKSKAIRRSKYDFLEESWNKKFGDLNEKVDLLLSRSMPAPQRCQHVESVYTDSSSNEEVSSKHDDVLSISASGKFSDSEDGVDENNNVSHINLSENTKKCFFDIFGEDAVVSKKTTQ